jgi:hypothetical protein
MAGHSRPKDGVASLAYVPAMYLLGPRRQSADAGDKRAGMSGEKPVHAGRSSAAWWYGAMALVGFAFGLLADRRPFGEGILVHPLVMFFILVGLSLLALRVLLARPVPEVISDRSLIAGCVLGVAAFLAGNFVVAQVLPPS